VDVKEPTLIDFFLSLEMTILYSACGIRSPALRTSEDADQEGFGALQLA